MKKIAMFGCTCLLVAHFVKDGAGGREEGDGAGATRYDPFAALAMDDDPFDTAVDGNPRRREDESVWREEIRRPLLAARCAMAALFFFVGLAQIKRIVARDFALFVRVKQNGASPRGVPRRPRQQLAPARVCARGAARGRVGWTRRDQGG